MMLNQHANLTCDPAANDQVCSGSHQLIVGCIALHTSGAEKLTWLELIAVAPVAQRTDTSTV